MIGQTLLHTSVICAIQARDTHLQSVLLLLLASLEEYHSLTLSLDPPYRILPFQSLVLQVDSISSATKHNNGGESLNLFISGPCLPMYF